MRGRGAAGLVLAVLSAAYGYAALRYVVLGDTPAAQLPMFVANKAVALAGAVVLAVAVASRTRATRRHAGLVGLALGGLHVVLSLPLLTPAYFPRFFGDGSRFTAVLEGALLTGGLALVTLLAAARPTSAVRPAWVGRASVGVLALVGLHAGLLGAPTWWSPAEWPGGLPPITLLSVVAAAVGLAVPGVRRSGRDG